MSSSFRTQRIFNRLYHNINSNHHQSILLNRNNNNSIQISNRHIYTYSQSSMNHYKIKNTSSIIIQSTQRRYLVELPAEQIITTRSWAREGLEKQGEKLAEPTPEQAREKLVLTDEYIENPPEKVRRISLAILELNMLEVNELVETLMKRLGVSKEEFNQMKFGVGRGGGGGGGGNNQQQSAAPVAAAVVEAPKIKEFFDLKLMSYDAKAKIKIIKEVRTVTALGLKEAKELVEKAPCMVKTGLKKEEAEALMKILVDSGAVVELL